MKRYLFALASLLMVLGVISCSTSTGAAGNKEKQSSREFTELIDRLRMEPGLNISGGAGDYTILLRGARSTTGDNSPLYVVNGNPVGTNYNTVSSSINVYDVKDINVLSASQASSRYGGRGSNGVIEITLK